MKSIIILVILSTLVCQIFTTLSLRRIKKHHKKGKGWVSDLLPFMKRDNGPLPKLDQECTYRLLGTDCDENLFCDCLSDTRTYRYPNDHSKGICKRREGVSCNSTGQCIHNLHCDETKKCKKNKLPVD